MLKLKLQYFGHLMWTADSLEKTLILGKTEERRRRGRQRTRWLDGISGHEFEQTLGDSEGQGSLVCCSLWTCKQLDRIEWPNNKNSKEISHSFLLLEKEISTSISVSLSHPTHLLIHWWVKPPYSSHLSHFSTLFCHSFTLGVQNFLPGFLHQCPHEYSCLLSSPWFLQRRWIRWRND